MARTTIFGGLIFGLLAFAYANPVQAAPHDGLWSVLIVTDSGTCDRGYRYGVKVADGHVAYSGQADINLSGTVSPDGLVKVSISKGGQSANGTGKLTANGGSGSWRGRGSAGECFGHWEAERR